jgi:hypothetical protein
VFQWCCEVKRSHGVFKTYRRKIRLLKNRMKSYDKQKCIIEFSLWIFFQFPSCSWSPANASQELRVFWKFNTADGGWIRCRNISVIFKIVKPLFQFLISANPFLFLESKLFRHETNSPNYFSVSWLAFRPKNPVLKKEGLKYKYASLNDGDTFWEMRRLATLFLCERHRVYLHKPR